MPATFKHFALALTLFFSFCQVTSHQNAYAADDASSIEQCSIREEHSSVTFLLIDRTDELKDVEHLKQTFATVRELLKQGERIVVGVNTGKLSDTRILMDMVRPVSSIWESTMKIRAREKKFKDCFEAAEKRLVVQDEEHPSSAILETLSFVSSVLGTDVSSEKRLIIFSDMIQNSEAISFYKLKEIDAEKVMQTVQKENLLTKLNGIRVYVAGIGVGLTDQRARAIESFWRQYFTATGAEVKFFGPVLVG
jgi:hypothetical protein